MTHDEIIAAIVKPLKWHNFDTWTWWAEAICGTYHVEEQRGFWRVDLRFRDAIHVVYEIDDFETVIAAAEADYRTRKAADLYVEKIAALVEAAERFNTRAVMADNRALIRCIDQLRGALAALKVTP